MPLFKETQKITYLIFSKRTLFSLGIYFFAIFGLKIIICRIDALIVDLIE